MAAAAPSYYQGAPPSRGGKGGGAPIPQGYPMAPHWGHPMVPPFPPHPHHMPPPPHAAPAHAGAHHAPHHQPQHQRGTRAPPQQPQPQQARGPYQQQPQHPRLAKTSRHKLNSTYERVISQPPPLPAFKANPPPLPLRADRAPTRNVVCVLPDGNRHTLSLDEQDTYNDVRALVEQQTPFCGQELCVYVGDVEVRDETLTLAQMGLAEDAVIVLKVDQVCSNVDGFTARAQHKKSSKQAKQTTQSRSGWGVAALPDERPGHKEENEEYKNLDHGDAKVLQGYTEYARERGGGWTHSHLAKPLNDNTTPNTQQACVQQGPCPDGHLRGGYVQAPPGMLCHKTPPSAHTNTRVHTRTRTTNRARRTTRAPTSLAPSTHLASGASSVRGLYCC